MCHWLANRAEEVLDLVVKHKTDPLDLRSRSELADDWRKVCTNILLAEGGVISVR